MTSVINLALFPNNWKSTFRSTSHEKKVVSFFSRVLRNSTLPLCLSIRLFVFWSVGQSHFILFMFFYSLTSLLLSKWFRDLKYGLCPPACDWGSRVSSLVKTKRVILVGREDAYNPPFQPSFHTHTHRQGKNAHL